MELPTPEQLRNKRDEELGLTQSEVADRAGVSQPLIARIESGDVDPRLSTLRSIVNALEEAEGGVVRASDLMHESVASVAPDDAVREAVEFMNDEAYSQLPVLDNGVPVGSISESDVNELDGPAVGELPVERAMSEAFPTVSADATVDEVRSYLAYHKAVIVTSAGEAIGIITEADVAAQVV